MSDLERLQPILATALDAVVVMDVEGVVVDWTSRAEVLLGWRREEVLGRRLSALILPSDAGEGGAEDAALFSSSGRPSLFDVRRELMARRQDGGSIAIELSMVRWSEPDAAPLVLGFIRDISRRSEALKRLVVSEARFRAAIDAVQGVLWTNNASGKMVGEQPAWSALTGQTREEYEGVGWTKVVHPDDVEPTLSAWLAAVAEKRTFEFEHRVRRHDGVWRDCLIRAVPLIGDNGEIREWVGVHTDISEQKAAAEKLRESEALFRTLADAAPAPVWMTEPCGGMEFANAAFAELANVDREALLGYGWLSLLHPDDIAGLLERRQAARAGPDPYTFEARFKRQPDGWRWMLAHAKPRIDATGAFLGYVGMAMDLSEIKNAQAQQKLLINELNHRVKNTLASIQSIARQTLRADEVSPRARDQFIDRLMAMSAAHNVLTNERWSGAVIDDILREALRPFCDDRDPERITITGPSVRVEPGAALALALAAHELGTNAAKYGALSTPHGRVTVAWSLRGENHALVHWRESGGPEVQAPTRRGFGARLLERGLATDLGGKPELLFKPEGVEAQLPVRVVRADPNDQGPEQVVSPP
ncbi:PAS domain S-box protein [Caulobacter vibrioides]|uniref:PAS domain S-box protein n=1 Tax=Caulobacter vibrioides TaxID=155892 RepID=UPI000BB4EC84|nr:PAS domain S-box protein [Caulobacter vibrioides]ATC25936.1 PAS domain S-box protein [Caulobacter vibrioides]AZH14079.1 PAS domain S-box protein [Caulobacter vibrioides]PLR16421.1 PAS domain S-box protein [Caulobacter vibrioides]